MATAEKSESRGIVEQFMIGQLAKQVRKLAREWKCEPGELEMIMRLVDGEPQIRIESERNYADLTEKLEGLNKVAKKAFAKLLIYCDKMAAKWETSVDKVVLILHLVDNKPVLLVRNEDGKEEVTV